MAILDNVLDPENLETNIKFAAMYILYYETLKDFVVNQPRNFLCDPYTYHCEEGKDSRIYKEAVRALDKNIEDASLKWFIKQGVITQKDFDNYQIIRNRRNDMVHNLFDNVISGFTQNDIELYAEMKKFYEKIDRWWINEIEIPITGEYKPGTYDEEGVMGMKSLFMQIMNDIMFGTEETKKE